MKLRFYSFALIALLWAYTDAQHLDQRGSPFTPKFRVSPIDGSKIALPTREQLNWQDNEIGMLIHFDVATYIPQDGCNASPTLLPNASLFDPIQINTDQWLDTITVLGARYGTLVAKHNCGFTLWPTNVSFPTINARDRQKIHYNYSVEEAPIKGLDVVQDFIDSCNKHGIGAGFYYSVVVNNYLRVQNSGVLNSVWVPGQVNITNSTYDQIVLDQLTELWSHKVKLTEIWFDGGYPDVIQSAIIDLLQRFQPQATVFNGCRTDGTCISPNSVRWIGNEFGQAPDPNWSTGVSNDGGDPTSPFFCPSECDTTLQTNDRWFFGVNQTLRSLKEMVDVYHQTVGRNCLLELDLTPDRTGLIPVNYVARYKELGKFIRDCYGDPVAHTVSTTEDGTYTMTFNLPTSIDRIVLMEDQTNGQVIRSYNVYAKLDDEAIADPSHISWTLLSHGTSIGHKKIDLFDQTYKVTDIFVNTTYVDTPKFRSVEVHLCDRL